MANLDRWIDNKIVQNFFIWFFLFLILLTTIQSEDYISSAFFAILLLAPPVYLNNLLILPFFKRKPLVFFSLFTLNTMLFTGISVFFIQTALGQDFKWRMFFNFMGIMILALVFASAIKLARDSFTRRRHEQEAELKLLKAQLNPHFLFNTLNNLYGLSVAKSDRLPNLMLKLSDLLRYSLYDTKETYVSLDKEIKYLENYMALEKLRLEDETSISLNTIGNISEKKIAPMLLIVFVENAFKHLSVVTEGKSHVHVTIEGEENRLLFKCINTFTNIPKDDNLEKGRSGIGLLNAKKRLAILYPEKHQLNIATIKGEYSVTLTLAI